MNLELPDPGLPLWLGVSHRCSPWLSPDLATRMHSELDMSELLKVASERTGSIHDLFDPAILGLIGQAGDQLLQVDPLSQATTEDVTRVTAAMLMAYLMTREVIGTGDDCLRYSASLGFEVAADHLKARVQRLDKAQLSQIVSEDLLNAAMVFALGHSYEMSMRPVAPDDLLDGLFVGLVMTGIALALAEHELVGSYLDAGVSDNPKSGDLPTQLDRRRPVNLSAAPMWFRQVVARATNMNETRLSGGGQGQTWVTLMILGQMLIHDRTTFPRGVRFKIKNGRGIDPAGLIPLAVVGVGAVLGGRVQEVAEIVGAPDDQLIEEITRQSIKFEWPTTTDAVIDDAMRLVYDQGPFDFPFRPPRNLESMTAAAGSYHILKRLYPYLPPLQQNDLGVFSQQVIATQSALFGYTSAVRQFRTRDNSPMDQWLDGQPADPSWE